MSLALKSVRVFFIFVTTLLWSCVAFALTPFTSAKREKRAGEFAKLTKQAIEKLGCDAKSVFLDLKGSSVRLHAVEAGPSDGKLVVLLHGFPESWYAWKHVIPFLAKRGYYVVAPDMRGYSFSDKPIGRQNYHGDVLAKDVAEIIRLKNRSTAYVVAHDWGAAVAWKFACNHPDLLEKLVILNCPHPLVFMKQLKTLRQLLKSWYMFFFTLPYLPEAFMLHDTLYSAKTFFKTFRKDAFTSWDLEVWQNYQSLLHIYQPDE
eukprot:TRINITY_DN278_c0_g2_i15.p1 TRINITY_DN278_c0_g2~~TRINITY_DN278_c0_g2_i15.p1  ORF type:complete len:261 (+),score=58.58 TRINITY_DN278_c0_g2_i15:49-831(+)